MLVALAASVLALAPATAGAAGCSETTAFPGVQFDRPFAVGCATAELVATPNPVDPAAPDPSVLFDGSGSVGEEGTEDEIDHYVWTYGDGIVEETAGPTVSHTYAARGRYVATLTIEDADDVELAMSPTVEVVVSALPTAALAPVSGTLRPGVLYTFDAGGSAAPGGTIDHYNWSWGDGTTSQTAGPVAQHAFADDGASTAVTVTVVNDVELASTPASQPIVVDNVDPVVQLAATPGSVGIGEKLTLSAAGSHDPDGAIAEYRWDLNGDGVYERSTGTTPAASAGGFPNPGTISLGVKVVDDSGDSTVKRVSIGVTGSGGAIGDDDGVGGGGSDGTGSGGGKKGRGSTGGADIGPAVGLPGGEGFAIGLSGSVVQRLGAALKRGIGLRASANRTARGKLTLTVSARDAKALKLSGRRGRKPVAIGTLRISVPAGRSAAAKVKLTRGAARALRHASPRTLRITVTGALSAGPARASAARVVLVRG